MGRHLTTVVDLTGDQRMEAALTESGALVHSVPRAIVSARVLTIFFMMYVHAWTGSPAGDSAAMAVAVRPVADFLVNVVGRSAVPLLTIISGYLLVTGSLARKNWGQVVADKVRSLLLPMWIWNSVFILLILMAIHIYGATIPAYMAAASPLDWIFAMTAPPVVLPLAFLRDLFVITLISPLLIAGMNRLPWLMLISAAAFTIFDPEQSIILRPQLLLFFLVGIGFATRWMIPTRLPAPVLVILSLLAITQSLWLPVVVASAGNMGGSVEIALRNLMRFNVALLCWLMCLWIVGSRFQPFFARMESIIFLAFCSHFILFRLIGQLVSADVNYLFVLFLVQPVLAIAAAFAMQQFLQRMLPGVLRMLNGGRLPRQRA